ncbi:alanine--tRNA ligase [Patescibacteria group bacterium]|nr:alanine--tRNA ligase [Patescibacteria group bacterium]MBU1868673.1 alanine--tRNA ligase [Patescibacteria group bacterium]
MTHTEIRKRFIEFFEKHNHQNIGSANLVAKNDPTLLLVNSGMAPIKPYFTGEEKPPHPRLTNIQKCVRTEDIECVGDPHHHTFFEMFGSWSIGDYGKKMAVELAWELLTSQEGFNLEPDKLYATVFAGDDYIPADTETISHWKSIGIPDEHILKLPASENLWVSGPTGPCGPCTEVLYDRGVKYSCGIECNPNCECGRFYEIWNAGVFMQYNRKSETEFEELPFLSVDTGAGLERFAAVLQSKESNYETDLFSPLITEITSTLNIDSLTTAQTRSVRIVADHLRAAFFLIGDGVVPSNKREGYILRRLIRRAITHQIFLKIKLEDLYERLHQSITNIYGSFYPEIKDQDIIAVLQNEHENFLKTLKKGLGVLEASLATIVGQGKGKAAVFPGEIAFDIEATYGVPLETQKEIAENHGIIIDKESYQAAYKKHQDLSRKGAEGKFGKVQEYANEEIAPLHTATHLMHQALTEVLGSQVKQAGQSLVPERLRFDFTFDRKLDPKEIRKVEKIVNQQIQKGLSVTKVETTFHEAVKQGAIALFRDKYKEVDQVTMYKINNFSKELCGGPHVANTSELGYFKIIKEESVGKGIRRIKATLEKK